MRLSGEEIVALIAKVRTDTLAEVSRQETQETLDRLDRVTATMRDVLDRKSTRLNSSHRT